MSSEFEIRIPIKATDEATPTFKNVVDVITQMKAGSETATEAFKKMRQEVREQHQILRVLREEAKGTGLTFDAFQHTLGKISSVAGSINSLFFQFLSGFKCHQTKSRQVTYR
ncbi:MAG: hypothetical protein RMJ14_06410 [Nitrososphaerota archaeon]|nr:hypothetical protein [Nitrososphaerota archaeon]